MEVGSFVVGIAVVGMAEGLAVGFALVGLLVEGLCEVLGLDEGRTCIDGLNEQDGIPVGTDEVGPSVGTATGAFDGISDGTPVGAEEVIHGAAVN